MSKFIDISEHNIVNNYQGLINSGLKGVIIKASEGTTYTDSSIEGKYANLNGKINIGFYHYLTSTSSPITQAEHFYELIKDKDFQIIPVLDVEQETLKGGLAESYSIQFMKRFSELTALPMIIYSGRCFAEEHFSDNFRNNNVFWIADYSANECPTVAGCRVIAWQYTENSKDYSSVFGEVDCSLLYDEDNFFIDKLAVIKEQTRPQKFIDIASLQNELNKQGFKDKNGNYLSVDNIAGELTLSACPTLKMGMKGNITKWVQEQLSISNDGIFGEQTRQTVIEYQNNMSLSGDGIVGKNTWRKLIGM